MMPGIGGNGRSGRTANTPVFIIELDIPGTRYRAPHITSPAIIVKAIVDQSGVGAPIEQKGKGDREIGGAGKVGQTVISKTDKGIQVITKLNGGVGHIVVIGGITDTVQGSGYIAGTTVGSAVGQREIGQHTGRGGLGTGTDPGRQQGQENDAVDSYGLHAQDFR